uniref:ATP synthase F0 subunit 6 n=1 Tax=Hymenolepis microstoma TaxID=85433 RepID=A0A1E1GI27_HYMMI|nr:ATP synthase F0 subunit 6 [Hymenolepis microstoma]BBB87189.1 ATP synthase subunit 6 [Hymenolepis microstoma]
MFSAFNNFNSLCSIIYKNLIFTFSYYYLLGLMGVLLLFISYRIPYCYSPYFFSIFLIVFVFSMFISLFTRRVFDNFNVFFSQFIPIGTPVYICPLVCLAETVSFIIRPIVLILRPFINISLGCFGTVAVCNLCFNSWLLILVIFLLFFYEVFVAVVHWYIVTSILSFSIDH